MGGRDQRIARIAWCVAFGVHAIVFALVSRVAVPRRPAPEGAVPVEIDVVPNEPPSTEPAAVGLQASRVESIDRPGLRGITPHSAGPEQATANAVSGVEGTWQLGGLFQETKSAEVPAILPSTVLRNVAAAQGALAHDAAPTGTIAKPDPSSTSVSFARANPLRARVAQAMSDPDAPTFGMATLEFTITSRGIALAGVRTSTNDEEWARWADKLAKGFDASAIPIPEHRLGLRVQVYVEAIERGVEGVPPPKQGGYLHGTPFRAKERPREQGGQIDLALPTASIGYEGKKCGAGVTVGAGGLSLNGGCELAPPTRQVRARIVEENLF